MISIGSQREARQLVAPRDPAEMTPEDRLTELSEALANACLRLLISRQKGLEDSAGREPSCVQVVNSEETA